MAKGEYTKILWPSGDAYKAMRCACCGGEAEAWQYITESNEVQRVVMCETNTLDDSSDDGGMMFNTCPMSRPSQTLHTGTLRQAVTWWNRINGLLVAKRIERSIEPT